EEPAEGAASAEAKAKPAGLKARVDDLLAALASGPRTIAELAEALGMEQKKVRSTIDTARRVGHTIACVGRGTFALPEAAQ
ncbi:ArsR family transcriptional regulator, partial [Pseudomonas aeruginosa]|nr:ArsR family transcriptional regulator [Pseudomonas aeruginosa]